MSRQIQLQQDNQSNYRRPETFKNSRIYNDIRDAGNRYKSRLNFTFRAHEVLQLLDQQPYNQKLERMLGRQLHNAVDRVDKRPIDDQIKLKNRYQKSHGLVFKGIPMGIKRQVVYHAIEKLGQVTKNTEGQQIFPGELKMRTFMYPQLKPGQKSRNAFPIFVNRKDKQILLQWASNQQSKIKLEPEPTEECPDFTDADWDGLLVVEKVRGQDGETDGKMVQVSHNAVPTEFAGYGATTPPVVATPPPGSVDVAAQLAHVVTISGGTGAAVPCTPPRSGYNAVGYGGQVPVIPGFVPFDPNLINVANLSGYSTPMSQTSDVWDPETGQYISYPLPSTSPMGYAGAGSYSSETSAPPTQFTLLAQQLNQQFDDQRPVSAHSSVSSIPMTMQHNQTVAPHVSAGYSPQPVAPTQLPVATQFAVPLEEDTRAQVERVASINTDSPATDDLD